MERDDDVFMTIAAHYLINRCEGCPFIDVADVCDSVPLNCKWLVLRLYFGQEGGDDDAS